MQIVQHLLLSHLLKKHYQTSALDSCLRAQQASLFLLEYQHSHLVECLSSRHVPEGIYQISKTPFFGLQFYCDCSQEQSCN